MSSFLSTTLPILAQNGWIGAAELSGVESTCSDASTWLQGTDAWRAFAFRALPHAVHLVGEAESSLCRTFRQLFSSEHFPRAWLENEVARVRSLPKWSETVHFDVECGRCGCNCNRGCECPGIPIESEFRYERIKQKGWPENRDFVPFPEGYIMSDKTMINVNRFCEPCFERLVKLDLIKAPDYKKVGGETVFGKVSEHVHTGKGRYSAKYYTPDFFFAVSDRSWQDHHGVNANDTAVVIAYALTQPECKYKHLDLAAFHFNSPGFGEKGY